MVKGDSVVLVDENGKVEDKGYYYIDEFVDDEEGRIILVGGLTECVLYLPENRVRGNGLFGDFNVRLMSVLVDIASSIKYLTEKVDKLIPHCPDCGEDMCCDPEATEKDEENDEDEGSKLN